MPFLRILYSLITTKELLVLQVAAHEGTAYEWEQHVSISQAAGVREDQFIAIAEQRFDDGEAFVLREEAKEAGSLLEASEVANVVMFMLTRPRGMTIRDVVMLPTNFDL